MLKQLIVNLMDLAISVLARVFRIDTEHLIYFLHWEDRLPRHWILSLRFPIPIVVGRRGEKRSKYIGQLGLSEFGAIDQSHNY